MAKPKPLNLNLSSMRKIPSKEVRDPNSPVNQILDQSGQLAAGNSLRKGEVHPVGRRKLEFHNMQISDSGYLDKSPRKTRRKGESCRCTTSGDPTTQSQPINLVNIFVGIDEASDSWDQIILRFGKPTRTRTSKSFRICSTSPRSWYTNKARF